MATAKSGAHFMVKQIFVFIFLFYVANKAISAELFAGLSASSWQENVLIDNQGQLANQLGTFNSITFESGVNFLFSKRYYYDLSFAYNSGKVDIHLLPAAVSPRKSFKAIWLNNKLSYRISQTFSSGAAFIINSRQIDGLDQNLNVGLFITFDFDLYEEVRLSQTLGTMGDSKQTAYSLGIKRLF
jgi:hypothetical protein